MPDADTIVALSSGAPPSGVAVVRLSGPQAGPILRDILNRLPTPRRLTLAGVRLDGALIDTGLVAWFPGPHSFTGEDCAELQLHGSPAVVRAALRALAARPGVRLAAAGEFTRRAFENGRLDLTEVEGMGDLIAAETESQRAQALARMAGGLTQRLDGWRARLLDLRAEAEARLDFADEGDVGLALPPEFTADLNALDSELREALAAGRGGRIVREGLRVALAGPPNVGKSSLINALAQSDVAIVTDEPGTTRDVREVAMDLGGRLVILLDMAGLRDTDSKAEAEGVRRARAEIAGADLVLWLVAPDVPDTFPPPPGPVVWRIATKGDLAARADADLVLSVRTGAGITALQQRLAAFAKARGGDPGISLVSRERDVAALTEARAALAEARLLVTNLELCAEALRRAGHALERLLGRMDADAVLDRLFLSFCIGK